MIKLLCFVRANTGQPNSGGSQFFINVANNEFLDWWRSDLSESKHPVFGRVTQGLDVVQRISQCSTDSSDKPRTPVVVNSITIR